MKNGHVIIIGAQHIIMFAINFHVLQEKTNLILGGENMS